MGVLRLRGFFCYDFDALRLASRTYAIICLICAAHCGQAGTSSFRSNPASSDIFHQSTSSNESETTHFLRGLESVQRFLPDITNKTDNSKTSGHAENNSSELTSLELVDDYSYQDYADLDYNLSSIGPEVLVDLGPEEMILSHDQGGAPAGRRRPVVKDGFVWEQKMELLRLHNMYRSNVTPPAADMNFMEWDEYLAKAAQDWANGCRFIHAFPPYVQPGSMGQNLYMGHEPTGVRAMLLWNEEYLYYDLKTLDCESGKQCGHYTQMVWADSKLVGCGMKRCGVKRFYVVCHYSPMGNMVGSQPYIVGRPCSQCKTAGGGLCTNNKCVTKEQCERSKEECEAECTLKCLNCGTLDEDTCRCSCRDGWDSLDCSRPCKNAHDRCAKNPGWPTVTSCPMNNHDVANVYCRKMCGKCYGVETSEPDDLCCKGIECSDGHTLDVKQNGCECKLLCPGPLCYTTPDDNYDVSESTSGGSKSWWNTKGIWSLYALIVLIHIFLKTRSEP